MLGSLKDTIVGAIVGGIALVASSAASALPLPALQLGPGAGTWVYDNVTQTWVTDSNPFSVNANANASAADGGNGDFAWDISGATSRYGYLVLAATPQINVDGFDVTVIGDGGALALVGAGFGSPPASDPNNLEPHDIYDTWYEIYEFQFNGAIGPIGNLQPGQTGTGAGYAEEILVIINSLEAGVTGIHMDLFTIQGDGKLDATTDLVKAFAPFSNDTEYQDPVTEVSEPAPLAVLAFSLAALGWARRRKGVVT